MLPNVLREKQLAGSYGLSAAKLRVYRTQRKNTGQVPESYKVGGKVYYHRDDVIDWLKTQGLELEV